MPSTQKVLKKYMHVWESHNEASHIVQLISANKKFKKKTGEAAQVEEHLPCKQEDLSSNPSTPIWIIDK